MKKKFTIAELWQSYKAGVLPADASETQINECKLAFYGGAQVMLVTFTSTAEIVSEDEGCQLLNDLHQEMNQFVACLSIPTSDRVQ